MPDYNFPKFFSVSFPAEAIAHVEINRPDKLNAFSLPMWHEYRQIFQTLSADSDIRAIILSGAGPRAFTAGLDITSMPPTMRTDTDPARAAWSLRHLIADWQSCISAVSECTKPVIAVLHGVAFGLAIDIATAADIRLCSEDVKLSVKEVDIGIAADIGTLTRLPKVVGNQAWVKEVCLTARVFGAEEARREGFVSGVFKGKEEAVKEALRLAALIAGKSPLAVQGTKKLLDYSIDHSVRDGLEYTQIWNAAMLQAEDPGKAIKATFGKVKPVFAKL